MQSKKNEAQSKRLEVKCECPGERKETIGSLAQKIFEGAQNLEVLINQSPPHLLNPLTLSTFQTKPCAKCEGRGWYYVSNGPDDYDKEECDACNSTGRVVAN
jgi:hypothetical protein